jgi:hypothetical protein
MFKWLLGLRAGKDVSGAFKWSLSRPIRTEIWEFWVFPTLFEDIQEDLYTGTEYVVDAIPLLINQEIRHEN